MNSVGEPLVRITGLVILRHCGGNCEPGVKGTVLLTLVPPDHSLAEELKLCGLALPY
jgi:hypothetical protein